MDLAEPAGTSLGLTTEQHIMDFTLEEAIPILRRTPAVLRAWLDGVPRSWILGNEGPGTWTPFDIVGHLVHGERTDWVPRTEHLLRHGDALPFTPFDRDAMFKESEGKTLEELLRTFETLRMEGLERLLALGLVDADLDRTGLHPELGQVTLRQLLATWVAHDLSHLAQIARIMARQYTVAVGPWRQYLSLLHGQPPQ